MKHTIIIDGQQRDLDIRPMDESFIVYRKMYHPPLTRDNIGKIGPDDWAEHLEKFQKEGWQKRVDEFLRKLTRVIGSCAILAWDGDGVIGKMYFMPLELYQAFRRADCFPCVENESMPRMIESLSDDQLQQLLASPSKTLMILCFNIGHFDTRYHRQGIASAMIQHLKEWARSRDWQKLEILSSPDIVPFRALGPNRLRRSYLEKRGFNVTEEFQIPPKQARFRRQTIEAIVAGPPEPEAWDYAAYPYNIENVKRLAVNVAWQDEYDKDYLMACDL